MNRLNWWQNLLGEMLLALIICGVVLGLSLLKEQPVPLWGWYLGAQIGIIMWTRPSYNRKQDFDA